MLWLRRRPGAVHEPIGNRSGVTGGHRDRIDRCHVAAHITRTRARMGSNMAIDVTPLHPYLGAEVRGVDLTRPVVPEVFAQIEAAFNRHGILVFPDQPLTDEHQLAFSRLFGPLEVNPKYAGATMPVRPQLADLS